ncbi:lipoprotein BA_5634 family protein [Bacillus cereus]|uniref:lipoprotein BA_5634 family protein n=1 Tax=Bacillus cereus TaxID=1396 RepID=UPI001E4FF50D|nr:lipoprotein BA_5634 family protein [Bacillus cereus]MEC2715748.1 lipoprotein BA_5634 family protein [Bacillus cereus]MEC2741725.1 lipoprotein BA_5634 family protein [Bacillus cereus]MEC2758198.1 lipoprotein BA_5634 family protein [Bacillus cereus]MEC2830490.1 lipoprotein BA_5634 family protein [Bacillus cereus]UUE91463.1 lipoprotein BA_5634 family protein [Bacillus cereus]
MKGIVMKRILTIFMLTIILLISFSACSKKDNSFPANGVLIIGDENNISPIINRYQEITKENEVFSVKKGEVGNGNVLILNESTAQALIKEKLFRKQDNGSNYIIDTLPKFPKEGSLLFTSEDDKTMKSIQIGEKEIPVTYNSDAWIGNNRKYSTEWYMIVAKDSVYKEIKVNEMKMHLLHLKKSLGDEKPKMSTDNTLVNENIKVKKLIKGLEGKVSFQFVTIGEKS